MAIRKVGGGNDPKPGASGPQQRSSATNRPLGPSSSGSAVGNTTASPGGNSNSTGAGLGGPATQGSPGSAPGGSGFLTPRVKNNTVSYAPEESKSVETLLHALTSNQNVTAEEGDKLWRQHLDRIASATEKVLQLAASHYDPPPPSERDSKKEPPPPPPHPNGNNTNPTGGAVADGGNEFFMEIPLEDDNRTPAERMADFQKDNQYIVQQLKAFQWCPFTAIRLLEILQDPQQYHLAGANIVGASKCKKGGMRGPKVQEAIRRCVLVTSPFFTTSTTGETI
eukprot:gene13437-9248_t